MISNPGTNAWSRVKSTGAPSPRCAHATCVLGDELWLFGGWDGNEMLKDLYRLKVATMEWEEIISKNNGPQRRAGLTFPNV